MVASSLSRCVTKAPQQQQVAWAYNVPKYNYNVLFTLPHTILLQASWLFGSLPQRSHLFAAVEPVAW